MPEGTNDVIKRLLVKMSLSLEDFNQGIRAVRDALGELDRQEKTRSDERKRRSDQESSQRQKEREKQQQQSKQDQETDRQKQAAEAQRLRAVLAATQAAAAAQKLTKDQINVIKQQTSEERTKLAVMEAQLRIMSQMGTFSKEAVSQVKEEITQERLNLALKTAQMKSAQIAPTEEKGFIAQMMGGGLQGLAGGVFGGGMVGMMAAGVTAGTMFEKVLEGIGQKIREMVQESTRLEHIESFFEGLAGKSGLDAKKTLDELQKATHGLVGDMELMVFANKLLQQNIPISTEAIGKMAGAVTDLARAQGQDAAQAMNMLARAVTTGHFRYIAFTLGLDKATQALLAQAQRLPTNVRALAEYQIVLDAVTKKLDETGRPTLTFGEQLTRLSEAVSTFFEKLAVKMTKGDAFGELGQKLSSLVDWIAAKTPAAVEAAAIAINTLASVLNGLLAVGQTVFGLLTDAVQIFASVVKIIPGLIQDINQATAKSSSVSNWFDELTTRTSSIAGVLGTLAEAFIVFWAEVEKIFYAAIDNVKIFGKEGTVLASNLSTLASKGPRAAIEEYKKGEKEVADYAKQLEDARAERVEQHFRDIDAIEARIHPGTAAATKEPLPKAGGFVPEVDLQQEEKLQKERTKLRMLQLQNEKEILKDALGEQEEMYRRFYDNGMISLQDYVTQSIDIRRKQAEAEKDLIREQTAAKLQEIATTQALVGRLISGVDAALKDAKGKLAAAKSETAKEQWQQQITTLGQQRQLYAGSQAEPELQRAVVRQEGANEIQKIENQQRAYERSEQAKLLTDQIHARQIYEQEILKLTKEGVDSRIKILEQEFSRGLIGADDYLAQRRALIAQQLTLTKQGLAQELADAQDNETKKAGVRGRMAQAEIDAARQLRELENQEDSIRVQGLENEYKRLYDFLSAQQRLAQTQAKLGTPGAASQEMLLTTQLISVNDQYLSKLREELGELQAGSAEWYKVVTAIEQVGIKQVQLNEILIHTRDTAGQLANMFSMIGRNMPNKAAAQWFAQMSSILKQFSEFNKYLQQFKTDKIGGATGSLKSMWGNLLGVFGKKTAGAPEPTDPLDKFKAQVKNAGQSSKDFGDALRHNISQLKGWAEEAKTKSQEFSERLTTAANKVATAFDKAADSADKFAKAQDEASSGKKKPSGLPQVPGEEITVEGGAAPQVPTIPSDITGGVEQSSAVSKFTSWLNKANDKWGKWHAQFDSLTTAIGQWVAAIGAFIKGVTSGKSTLGGVASGGFAGLEFGAQFGPIGAAVGTAAGAVLGGVFGHKNEEAKRISEDIKKKFDQIIKDLDNGTVTLGDAIKQLQAQRQAAVGLLRDNKKLNKSGQAVAILQQYTDEINQLLAQQKKIFQDLHTELETLSAPSGYQGILNSLEEIIKKYQEFANAAAGNTQEVANANQWLVLSLQQYAKTLDSDVNAANQTAVEDAIKYNDLLTQRQQLLDDARMKEYDLLTQGTLSRQRSQAQVKGGEIEKLHEDTAKALDQLDQEIAVAKYKVDAESKIFNLASDRIGLEKQLLLLQEQAINTQMVNVAAMVASLAKLQATLASGQLPPGLFNALGGIDMQALGQLLGINIPTVIGGGHEFQNEPPVYRQFLDAIDKFGVLGDFTAKVWAAAKTPPGSAQRTALTDELRNYELSHDYAIGRYLNSLGLLIGHDDPNWPAFFNWIANQAMASGQQAGGFVPHTGMTLLHPGEYVIPAHLVRMLSAPMAGLLRHIMPSSIDSLMPMADDTPFKQVATPASSGDAVMRNLLGGGTATSSGIQRSIQTIVNKIGESNQLDSHRQMYDLAVARVGLENELLNRQAIQMRADMERMATLQMILDRMSNMGSGGMTSLEGGLAKIYELRGRYGSAGFRRETL